MTSKVQADKLPQEDEMTNRMLVPAVSLIMASMLILISIQHSRAQTKDFAVAQAEKATKQSTAKNRSFPEIRIGSRVTGALDEGSDVLPEDSSYIDRYRLIATPGSGVVVDMASEDFDTFLIAQDLQGNWLTTGDDAFGATDSRIFLRIPSSGEAWILANSYSAGSTGSYELAVVDAADAEIPGIPSPSPAAVDTEFSGRLTQDSEEIYDGTRADTYRVEPEEQTTFQIEMSSSSFASYIMIVDLLGDVVAQASSSGPGDTANLVFDADGGAPFFLLANQVEAATGPYRVRISPDKGPEMPKGNDPDGRYAMVVGIADYPDGVGDLALVARDVEVFEAMLVDELGYDRDYIYVLEDHHATRDNVLNGISEFLGRAGPDGTAAFYFSGHGTQAQGNVSLTEPIDIEEDGVDEAFVAYDKLIIDDEVGFALRLLDAGHITAFVDSCHAGTAVRDGVNQTKFIKAEDAKSMMPTRYLTDAFDLNEMKADGHDFSTLDDRIAYYASSMHDELSWTAGDVNMSIYTFFLTETMPRFLGRSMADLDRYMSPRVVEYSRNNFGSVQTPNAEGNINRYSLAEQLGLQ
jgi:hypothetical protein